jgi:hypothetical protein
MRIESYGFGTITIDGRTFTRDLKIIRGKVLPGWWRKEGHNLVPEDIEDVLAAGPDVLVVGTGHDGLMRLSPAVTIWLRDLGIELVARPTRQACDEFNRLSVDRDAAFAAHLTC